MKLSLVIPMYNEQSIIEEAISTFYGFLKEKYDDFELIFVSDGSTDGCDNAVALAAKNDDRIKLCSYMPNHGKGYAVKTGMLEATGDIVIFNENSHIGIVSDKRNANGQPLIIHNGGQPNREEDYLPGAQKIAAHYRFDASRVPEDMLIEWEGD